MSDFIRNDDETLDAIVGQLSYQDQQRILKNLIWDVFGEVDNRGEGMILPNRAPDKVDVESLAISLREEFFPEFNQEDDDETND